ncbi:MAG: hypothetical protein IJ662_08050 [Clostridia bacterium]|nr:hypothetical protein [Clostridia bacterium]
MRKTALRLISLLLLLALLPAGGLAAEKQLRGYDEKEKKDNRYQYVSMGTYPYEKDGATQAVLWRVLSVEDNQALLMTEWIIDKQQVMTVSTSYNDAFVKRKYERIGSFQETDLCAWLNTTMLDKLMGTKKIRNALVETDFGKLFLLTDEQMLTTAYGFKADRYFDHPERMAYATPYAKTGPLYSWSRKLTVDPKYGTSPYWVAAFKYPDDMKNNYYMQVCGGNGHLSYGAYARVDVGIRPAVLVDLTQCTISAGSGTKEKPYKLKYTGTAGEN